VHRRAGTTAKTVTARCKPSPGGAREIDAAHGLDRAVTHAEVAHLDRGEVIAVGNGTGGAASTVTAMGAGRWRTCRRAGIGLLVVSLSACSAGGSTPAATRPSISTPSTLPPKVATVDWAHLHNPIVSAVDHTVKDAALVAADGTWFTAFSAVDTKGVWRIGIEHSTNLRGWSPMTFMPHDAAVEGEASPDVVRAPDGKFVITYQSFVHDVRGGLAKLYYRTTTDFTHFSPAHQLLRPVLTAPTDRVIDAALAWTPAGLLLGFKTGSEVQAFELARSTSGTLDGPWQVIGKPDISVFGDTIENYQFIRIDGRWKLLATSNVLDRPFLFDLVGDPSLPNGWLRWSKGRQLDVPREAWNAGTGLTGTTMEHANCAYLVDRRSSDGYFYLLYEDAPEKSSFGGEGHGVLAIARSTDLVHWSVP
jgi:hypothetical protein